MIVNKLYTLSFNKYIKYIKEQVLNTQWFKKACKDKRIVVKYLAKEFSTNIQANNYFQYKNAKIYFYKIFLLKFEYKDILEDNNHLKLLNINIVNETRFKVVELLVSLQKEFLDTNHFFNMKIINRDDFIKEYMKVYYRYLDSSVLSKVLNNTYFLFNKYLHKLDFLVPKKRFIYSIYIKNIINTDINTLKNDEQISKLLYTKYNIKLSRRVVCDIRNRYFIPKIQSLEEFKSISLVSNFFSNKRV